jgi:hypothetical protein
MASNKFTGQTDADLAWNLNGIRKVLETKQNFQGIAVSGCDLERMGNRVTEIEAELRRRKEVDEIVTAAKARNKSRSSGGRHYGIGGAFRGSL